MNEWIKVTDKLPDHKETVLVYNGKSFCIVCFIDTQKVDELKDTKIEFEHYTSDDTSYFFCSKEVAGNILNGVTHWKRLVPPAENYNG